MICPQCDDPLTVMEATGLELDQCPVCHGIWFDKDELKPFIDYVLEVRGEIPHDNFDPTKPRDVISAGDEESFTCPVCNEGMYKLNYGYDSNVILDRCGDCEGVWVEKPEVHDLAIFLKGSPVADRLADARARMAEDSSHLSEVADAVTVLARVLKYPIDPTWLAL